MLDLGTIIPGTTIHLPFHTFDSNDPSESVTITGLAVADIAVYKDGGNTARASTAGFALLGTDGIDEFGGAGLHGISIDLADNTTANFYEAGSQYFVRIADVTADAGTIRFFVARFRIGYPGALLDTTITSLTSQTQFILEDGSADADAYNGCICYVHDLASAVQVAIGLAARSAHGGSLAGVEHAELDARGIGQRAHGTAESVDLAHDLSLAQPTYGGVAAHLPDPVEAEAQQRNATP